jgi:hypothetical protein
MGPREDTGYAYIRLKKVPVGRLRRCGDIECILKKYGISVDLIHLALDKD